MDFRAFYNFPPDPSAPGIADGYFGNFSSERFFRLCERTFAFSGVMAARAMEEKKEPARSRPASAPTPGKDGKIHVHLTQLMLMDPTLIEYERV